MNTVTSRMPTSRNGRLAVGCGGLVGLFLICGICNSLASMGKPPVAPTPAAAATATEQPATATSRPTATDKPKATATDVVPTEVPATASPTEPPAPTAAPTAAPAAYNPDPDKDHDCDEWAGHGGGTAAQAWWNINRTSDRPNPGGLDGNGNGVPCEENDRSAPPPPPPPTPVPAPAVSDCININSAPLDQLMQIPEVKEDIANQILQKRPFKSWADLVKRVSGIGNKNVEQVKTRGCLP